MLGTWHDAMTAQSTEDIVSHGSNKSKELPWNKQKNQKATIKIVSDQNYKIQVSCGINELYSLTDIMNTVVAHVYKYRTNYVRNGCQEYTDYPSRMV